MRKTTRLPFTCLVFSTRLDVQICMVKLTQFVLSYVASDRSTPGTLEDHKSALVFVGDAYLHQQLSLYRCQFCTCAVSLCFSISLNPAVFGSTLFLKFPTFERRLKRCTSCPILPWVDDRKKVLWLCLLAFGFRVCRANFLILLLTH